MATKKLEVVKSFYALETGGENYYHINTIVKSEDMSEKLLKTAITELKQFQKRFKVIQNKLRPVYESIYTIISEFDEQ